MLSPLLFTQACGPGKAHSPGTPVSGRKPVRPSYVVCEGATGPAGALKGVHTMECPRCQGRLIQEGPVGSGTDSFEPTHLPSLRCLNCGFVCDPVMLMNRAFQHRQQVADAQFSQVA